MTPPAVLVGVDIVEADRLARAAERGGEVFCRHLGGGGATFSVKESFIKAVGGRPPGFSWHDFEPAAEPAAAWTDGFLDAAVEELSASTGLALTEGAAYAVRGACKQAALVRLPPHEGEVSGAARWGSGHGLFVALAIVFVDRKGNR